MAAVNGTSPLGISAADLANMDIESALMMVQTQRANLLESQLKDQMEAVRARNEQINALNSMLAEVRRIRPTGDTDSKANLSSGGNVQVPISGSSTTNVDQVALAAAQAELTRLIGLKASGATTIPGTTPTGTTGGGGTGTTGGILTVPSDYKPTAPAGSPAEKPAKALADFIDGGKANPVNYGTAIGSNGEAITGFLNYYNTNKALIDAKYSNPAFNLGFNTGSDARDIEKAFEGNANLRKEYETYLRLAVQGGGTASPPGTPIIDPRTPTTPTGTTGTTGTGTVNIDDAIKAQNDLIKQLQAGQQVSGTTFSSKSLQSALVQYGFISSGKNEMTQAEFDQLIQTISSRIDGLNSTQQLDMLRLQSLTNKRNEAFDIMTNFIKK
ncbi:MAG: hypothetical protein JNM08_00210, partial [Rubrivivax sp.]|nr:hypothetical protein [Rubrivivax sp.]